jgi:hypothetical protein
MSEGPANRRRFRFSLWTFFVAVTILGVWLGYHVNWIRERRSSYEWIESHGTGNVGNPQIQPRPSLPWTLRLLGEKPLKYKYLPVQQDRQSAESLEEFRSEVQRIQRLFPECQVDEGSQE